ncbi:hypothetical protein [Halorarum halobium]|uniref:hypothetical protein n=1 Tax=Halorarum halobium TaxID=3075121 RepID=UPI0028B233C7|nr:hypothetical protein [Halobaculum sp. XH14]
MTDDALNVQILSSEGGMQNELKISDGEDLQVAIEALQLAARFEFGEDYTVDTGSDQDPVVDEIRELSDKVESLDDVDDERFQEIEDRLDKLRDFLGKGFSEFQEMKDKVEDLQEASAVVTEDKESTGDSRLDSFEENGSEEQEDSEPTEQEEDSSDEEDDSPDLSRMSARDIVEEDLVDIDVPYSYDDFKDLSEAKQRAVLYSMVLSVQPATKVEVADTTLESDVTDSNDKRAQYIGYRLENKVSYITQRRRPTDQGKDPYEFAEEDFDFEEYDSQEEGAEDGSEEVEDEEDTVTSDEEKSSVERTAEAMAEDAPPPSEDTDEGAYGLEWQTVEQAIADYKEDDDKNYLLCIRSMKSFAAPISAKTHSEEDEGEVWAAAEELPDEFLQ